MTLAGVPDTAGSVDGAPTSARFDNPTGIGFDSAGNMYISDTGNQTIRKVTPAGVVSTFAGTPGVIGTADGVGTAAAFAYPSGVAVDSSGNIFVADSDNSTIRKITPGGVVTTFAGTAGANGYADGIGAAARFDHPAGLAIDSSNNLYVADYTNTVIRKVTPTAVVTTLAGSAGQHGTADGLGSAARFHYPHGVAVEPGGIVYVADSGNHTIRKITPDGMVATIAGVPLQPGSADGVGTAATFNSPHGLARDNAGNIYIADRVNNLIRKMTPAGVVTTIGGSPGNAGSANGVGTTARFNFPTALAVNSDGELFVTDTFSQLLRKGWAASNRAVPNDFNNDGYSDILYRNSTTGATSIVLMNGTRVGGFVPFGTIASSWNIGGTTDFNADGKTDILWRDTDTGSTIAVLMNGTAMSGVMDLHLEAVSADWRTVGAADFNGDGKTDILWRNSQTGGTLITIMNGSTIVSVVDLGYIALSWAIAGTGDFNRDGKPDILWRNTDTGGTLLTLMNGTSIDSVVDLGFIDLSWQIVRVGDYNSDGNVDISWRNTQSGKWLLVLMNHTSIDSAVDLGVVNPN
jgi:sugar lactone lactonase YvrE